MSEVRFGPAPDTGKLQESSLSWVGMSFLPLNGLRCIVDTEVLTGK